MGEQGKQNMRWNWPGVLMVAISAGLVIFLALELRKCERECPPKGSVLVSESYIDSLRSVAEIPPDTVTVERIEVKDTVIYIIKKSPKPVFVDLPTGERHYTDSLTMTDDGINAWVKIKARGVIEEIVWGYQPVYKTITKEITIPKPYPVYHDQIKPGLIAEAGIGWGDGPGFKVGLKYQHPGGLTFGAEVAQFQQRYYMATIGYRLW